MWKHYVAWLSLFPKNPWFGVPSCTLRMSPLVLEVGWSLGIQIHIINRGHLKVYCNNDRSNFCKRQPSMDKGQLCVWQPSSWAYKGGKWRRPPGLASPLQRTYFLMLFPLTFQIQLCFFDPTWFPYCRKKPSSFNWGLIFLKHSLGWSLPCSPLSFFP